MATKYQIKREVEIIKKEIEIVKNLNVNNQVESIIELIKLRNQSEFKGDMNHYINWVNDQVFNNDLPECSSGSFLSAVKDIDNVIAALGIEENEELVEYLQEIF